MKIIILVVLFICAGVFYYVSTDSTKSEEETAQEEILIHPIANQSVEPLLEMKAPISRDSSDFIIDDKIQKIDTKKLSETIGSEVSSLAKMQITEDMIGYYDPNAMSPEFESVQTPYIDSMIVSESSGLAPEAGSEKMPISVDMQINSEPVSGLKGPEKSQ